MPLRVTALDEGVNEPLMKELATLGGGRYYFAPTNADLETVLRDLGVALICQQSPQVAQPAPQQGSEPVVVQPIVNAGAATPPTSTTFR